MKRYVFSVCVGVGKTMHVSATHLVQAMDATASALPHLGVAERERSSSLEVSEGIRYTLTCLLCQQVNPRSEQETLLVSMQEHLMRDHGLTYAEQAQAASVSEGTPEGCYVWWTEARGAYQRASRYASHAEEIPPHRFFSEQQVSILTRKDRQVVLYTRAEPTKTLKIALVGEDERAWYGHLDGSHERLLIFPEQFWGLV